MINIKAKDIMISKITSIKMNLDYNKIQSLYKTLHDTILPIVDKKQNFIGFFSYQYFKAYTKENFDFKECMITDITSVNSNTPIKDININVFTHGLLPILSKEKLIGIMNIEDFYNASLKYLQSQKELIENKNKNLMDRNKILSDKYIELKAIMELSYDGIAITNSDGITEVVNKAWVRLTGLNKKDVIGIPLSELVKNKYFSDSVTMKVLKKKRSCYNNAKNEIR